MAASLSRPCFLSLHVPYGQGCAQDLAAAFRFQPVAVRETPRVRQLALRRGNAVFLLNQRLAAAGISDRDFLYDVDPRPTLGTASNVCLEVDDVPGLCEQLQSRGCTLPVSPTELRDEHGSVTYGVVSSVVGNEMGWRFPTLTTSPTCACEAARRKLWTGIGAALAFGTSH
ncbi:hypothetical protein ASZ78_000457 [Callipepla squamata]|uniref:VOC domain-containing protein n=1 Tax=Callipepla squamata TaxID=9009 RepID=A0A226NML5_CALSU|nr:hypothetical protein ASZ78_000457 [Callipepla squamata]